MGTTEVGARSDAEPGGSVEGHIDVAGAGAPNTRSQPSQDRWAVGRNERGTWLIVADGIGGGEHGERAAESAVHVASAYLITSPLDEGALMTATGLAQAAVSPWYLRTSGGCTLSIVAITPSRVSATAVGDSPVLLEQDGVWRQASPALSGPLRSWIGNPEAATPWLGSWPADDVHSVLVCSDGVVADCTPVLDADPHAWVHGLLKDHRNENGDDATAVAAALGRRRR